MKPIKLELQEVKCFKHILKLMLKIGFQTHNDSEAS